MMVLDTNVVSEMMAASPNPAVVAFLDGLDELPALTAVTVAELRLGIEVLPSGKRRDRLVDAAERLVGALGAEGVLPFDASAARAYAAVVAFRRSKGRPISQFDAMIAAICRVHRSDLVTRNVTDFELTGLRVVNPWAN